MGVKDFYFKIEDKYYACLDWLDKKGISLYPVVDAIESKGIPSFPVMLLILALIIIGLWLLIGFFFFGAQANITFLVTDATDNTPLEGAQISFAIAGEEKAVWTESNGEKAYALPFGSIEVTVSKTGYQNKAKTINVSPDTPKQNFALDKEIEMLSRTIQLMNDRTNQALLQEATIEFSCSNPEANYSETKTTSNGRIDLKIPANCGRLLATPVSGFTTQQGSIDISDSTIQIFLDAVITEKGTVNALVKDKQGIPIIGATVRLVKESGIEEKLEYSSSSGSVSFANVPTGKYYLVVHAPNFAEYNGIGEIKELRADETITFNVALENAASAKIKVIVKDIADKKAIKNVEIRLKQNGTILDTKYTDSDGKAEFDAVQGSAYDLEIDHASYLFSTIRNIVPKDSFNEVFLEAVSPGNSNTLYVTVLDILGNPVENAKVALKDIEGKQIGNAKATGNDGKTEFRNLPFDSYLVYAEKKGFTGKTSDTIVLAARQKNEVKIVLDIGFGKISVLVMDSDGKTISGADVKAINPVTEKTEAEESTDSEGKAEFDIRADKIVYLVAEAEDYLPYTTAYIVPDAGSTVEKEIILIKDVGKLEVELQVFSGNERILGSLAEGQQYTAKLLLKIPKNTSYSEAGVHFRTGTAEEGRTITMQQDNVYIKEARASTRSIVKGTSYSPNQGYAKDSANLTTADAKWVNATWKNAKAGVYEMEADIQARDTAMIGDEIDLWYRTWGKTTGYSRYPADNELGSSESSQNKQALYANAKLEKFTIGPSNLCGNYFCKSYTIKDLSTNIQARIVDSYTAKIGNLYRLSFTLLNNSGQAFGTSMLKISNDTSALRFLDYSITDAFGFEMKGSANAYEISKEIGTIESNIPVYGIIEFEVEEEGLNPITIAIDSVDSGRVFDDTISIEVEAGKEMSIDVLPKTIVPLIDNELLARVHDGNSGIPEAIVTFYLNDAELFSGKTNSSGEINYKLQAPSTGSLLRITSSKPGYKKAEVSIKISDEILLVTPPEIFETLSANEFEKEIGIKTENATQIPLQITSVSAINLSPEGLVELVLTETVAGKEIPVNSDANFFVIARLTAKGLALEKTTTINGALSIEVKNTEFGRTFIKNIPMQIRIALAGAVDDAECLVIEPGQWEIITSGDEKTIEITLSNMCQVSSEPIALKNLQARLDTKESGEIGSFRIIDSDNTGASPTAITKTAAIVLPLMEKDSELKLTIQFLPDNEEAAEALQNIVFEATNPTENKIEKLSAKIETSIFINDYADCIKITPDRLIIFPAAFNTGYENYQDWGYNPTGYNGYGSDAYNGYTGGLTTGYLAVMPSTSGGGYIEDNLPTNSYPYSQADIPWQSRYYDNAGMQNWNYELGSDKIKIENTCTIPIEISLSTEDNLKTSSDKITIEPEESQEITVEAGYQTGLFSIEAKAKAENSKDKGEKVKEIIVEVKRPEEISDECIDFQPKRISLNSFYGKPQPARIYNYCYNLGVRIEKTGRPVEFACRVAGAPGMLAEQEKPQTLLFQNSPYPVNNPVDAYGRYTGTSPYYNYGQTMYDPYYSGATTGTTTGYLGDNYPPQPYTPYNSYYNSYNPNPTSGYWPSSPSYSPLEQYAPQGSQAPYGQGYYNDYPGGNGYYYPGYNSTGGTTGGYMGGSYPQGSNGWNYASSGGYEGTCPVVDSVYIMSDKKYYSGNNTTQVVELEVTPNMMNRQQLCPYTAGGMPYQNLMGLRMASMGAYYRSNIDATAQVRYETPIGAQTAFFRVEFEDMWGNAESLEACLMNAGSMMPRVQSTRMAAGPLPPGIKPTGGTRNIEPQNCVVDNLNLVSYWEKNAKDYKGFVPDERWEGNTYGHDATIMKIAPNACGTQDKISLSDTHFTDPTSAVDISLKMKNNSTVELTAKRIAGKFDKKCVKINDKIIKADLARPIDYGGTKAVEIKLSIWILHEGIKASEVNDAFLASCATDPYKGPTPPPEGSAALDGCDAAKGEFTGTDAATKFGFDRLPWAWEWNEITSQTCDPSASELPSTKNGGMFCDAVQFSIELSKKAGKTKEYVEKLIANYESAGQPDLKALFGEETEKYKNTSELFRWALKQTSLSDSGLTKLAKEKEPLENILFIGNNEKLVSISTIAGNKELLKEALGSDYENIKQGLADLDGKIKQATPDSEGIIAALEKINNGLQKDGSLKHPAYIYLEIAGETGTGLTDSEINLAMNALDMQNLPNVTQSKSYYVPFAGYAEFMKKLAGKENAGERSCFKAYTLNPDGTVAGSEETANVSEAKMCIILPVYGTEEVAITTEFLNNLYSSIAGFKIVPVHTAELAKEKYPLLVNYLMSTGAMTEVPEGYSSLLQYYYENIEFESYLIKDNYSGKFISDFGAEYADQIGEAKLNSLWSNTEEQAVFEIKNNSAGSKQLEKSGSHNISLKYSWGKNEEPAWNTAFELQASLTELAKTLKADKLASNKFLEAPVDGVMAMKSESRDYGIGFNSRSENVIIAKAKDAGIFATKGNGNIALEFKDTYDSTKNGEILKISGSQWVFSPSQAVKLQMKLMPNNNTATALYKITKGAAGEASEKSPLFKWAADKGEAIEDKEISGTSCSSSISGTYPGITAQIKTETTYKAAGFFPIENTYNVTAICANKNMSISAKGRQTDAANQLNSIAIDIAKPSNAADYSIKQYLEWVKENKVCVASDSGQMILKWNAREIAQNGPPALNATTAPPASQPASQPA